MEKTADLVMIQRTIIDTLHKEGKSQRVITERVAVVHKQRMTTSLRILSSKAYSNTWKSFTRSGLRLESVHQESPRSDIFRKRATKPLLNQRQRQKHLTWAVEKKNWTVDQWSKVLFSDESTFCISFGNQGLESGRRVERHRFHVA